MKYNESPTLMIDGKIEIVQRKFKVVCFDLIVSVDGIFNVRNNTNSRELLLESVVVPAVLLWPDNSSQCEAPCESVTNIQ